MEVYLNTLVQGTIEENNEKIIRTLSLEIKDKSLRMTIPLMEVETHDIQSDSRRKDFE